MAERVSSGTLLQKVDAIFELCKEREASQHAFNADIVKRLDELNIKISEATTKKTKSPPKEKEDKHEKAEKADVKQPFPTNSMIWFKRCMRSDRTFMEKYASETTIKDFDKRVNEDENIQNLSGEKRAAAESELFWDTYCKDKSETRVASMAEKIKADFVAAKKEHEQKSKTPASKEN